MFGTANGLNGENVMTGLFGRVALGVKKGSFLGAQSYTGMLTEQLKAQEQSALSIINQYTGDEMLNQLRVAGATQGGLFAEISKNLDAVSGSAASARQYVTTLSAAMQNSAKAGGAFKNVLKGIGTSLLNWGTMMAATFIIGLVVDGIDQIVNRAKYAQEALDSMSSKFKENSDDLKKSNALIEQYGKRYQELSKKVDPRTNRNLGLSKEEYQEYLTIVNALGNSGLNIKIGTDLNGNALISSMDGLGATMEGLKAAYEQQAAEARKEILGGDQMANLAKTELFQNVTDNAHYGADSSEQGTAIQLAEHLIAAIEADTRDSDYIDRFVTKLSTGKLDWMESLGIDVQLLTDKLSDIQAKYVDNTEQEQADRCRHL